MRHLGGTDWAAHDRPDVGSDSSNVYTQFHTDKKDLNWGGGMNTQPSRRLRHIYSELGQGEMVGGEPLV